MQDLHHRTTSSDNPQSLATFQRALRCYNTYLGDPLAAIDHALAADPGFVMGHVLRGHVHLSMWEKSVLPELDRIVATLAELDPGSTDRERRHTRALSQWAGHDWDGARATLDRLVTDYPRDLLAIQTAHLADFFHGDRDNLRGRIARVLPAWSRDDPGYGSLLGMYAFGLEECGAYGAAEETGRHALEIEPDDSWAHHAVVHVLEMQARQAEGVSFVEGRTAHWTQPDNAFRFHNWWHAALYHLDQDHFAKVLEIYDQGVRGDPAAVQVMLLDAAALLWRLHLRGHSVGNRWQELAGKYESDNEGGFYAFNDVHAMMAFVATENGTAAAARLAAMETAAGGEDANALMTRTVGLPVARALAAFGRERYAEAVDLLLPVRYRAHAFGGSHAQRDILYRTLIEAALRGGDRALAVALCNERTALKPQCPYSWQLHDQAKGAMPHTSAT